MPKLGYHKRLLTASKNSNKIAGDWMGGTMTRTEMLRQMIEEYGRKIEMYKSMIREWEIELGTNGSASRESETYAAPLDKRKQTNSDPLLLVKEYQFYSKSQPDAAKLFLETVGHPLKTADIIAGIEKGGVKIGGKTPKDKKTNLYTILHRGEDFALLGKDAWGLTSWPNVKKEKEAKQDEAKEGASE
jgi:hypothetical protein